MAYWLVLGSGVVAGPFFYLNHILFGHVQELLYLCCNIKPIHMKITTINPTRIVASILFAIAWYAGEVTGIMAWVILLLLIDFNITLR